jgi:protein-S-isoprenylcysteine O-methyltransferase Ste14
MWFIGRYNLGNTYSLLPKAEKIISRGLYSKIKHPLYLSQLLVLGGAILYIDDSRLWWLFIAISILQFYRSKKEEKVLLEKFGDDYKNYMESTWV